MYHIAVPWVSVIEAESDHVDTAGMLHHQVKPRLKPDKEDCEHLKPMMFQDPDPGCLVVNTW